MAVSTHKPTKLAREFGLGELHDFNGKIVTIVMAVFCDNACASRSAVALIVEGQQSLANCRRLRATKHGSQMRYSLFEPDCGNPAVSLADYSCLSEHFRG